MPYFFDSFDMRFSINFKTLFELAHGRMRDYLARNKADIDMRYLFPFDAEVATNGSLLLICKRPMILSFQTLTRRTTGF